MMVTGTEAEVCGSCGGRGWKFLGLRRDPQNAGDSGELAMLRRPRTTCLDCGGTGTAQAAGDGS